MIYYATQIQIYINKIITIKLINNTIQQQYIIIPQQYQDLIRTIQINKFNLSNNIDRLLQQNYCIFKLIISNCKLLNLLYKISKINLSKHKHMKPKDMSYCKQIDEKQFPNNSVISTLNNSHRPTTNNTHRKYDQTPNQITFVNSELFDSHIFQEKKNKKNQRRDVMNKSLPAWGVSSSTLRHNSAKYSFSKDSRFKNQKCSHLDIQHLTLSSTLKNKSCTFGKGRRTPISQIVLNNAKFKPSPDRYDLTMYNETTRNKNLGKTFGIPWSDYQKIYITHRKDAYSHHFTKDNAEAIYEVRQIPGKHKRKFSMYKRLKMFNQYQADLHRMVPGPVHVVKDDFQKIKKGLNERNFGFGQRIDLAKPANDYPSPAAYNLKGFCSGFKIK